MTKIGVIVTTMYNLIKNILFKTIDIMFLNDLIKIVIYESQFY